MAYLLSNWTKTTSTLPLTAILWNIGWSSIASKGNLVQAFSKFSPEVQQLVGKADDSLRVFALSDFEPLPTWVRGRMALLGDAAHVLQPCESNALASPFPAPCDALM